MKGRLGIGVLSVVLLAAVIGPASAWAKPVFHHRVHRAMGLIPARNKAGTFFDPAVGSQTPIVYHGGSTMASGGVTLHTIFWAPPGHHFTGSPSPGVPGYEPLIKQFLADTADDSGSGSNVFSVLGQYGDNAGAGRYSIAYNGASGSIDDTDPYPSSSSWCASPAGIRTCITDGEVTREVDRIIQRTDPGGRGLKDIWEVFLPSDVDECIAQGVCGTSYYSAYHSLADEGHGTFIYAVMVDPFIELPPLQGNDPQGNPDAEAAIDTTAHETIEAITDPEGVGWMDPSGSEVGDACQSAYGTPLGFAQDGSPYNQLINGHEYEIQDMWSNHPLGCLQSGSTAGDGLPLPTVSLSQFSPRVSGNIDRSRSGVRVRISLIRGGERIAGSAVRTRANGAWGPAVLHGAHGVEHAVGDDRDTLVIQYGAGGPPQDVISTVSADVFASGVSLGWVGLDTAITATHHSVTVEPCFQNGVLTVLVNRRAVASPVPECNSQTDVATVPTPRLTGASQISLADLDNRASSQLAPAGALVGLTVPVGEPDSLSGPTGVPACTAQLRLQTVVCSGLVAHERYRLVSSRRLAVHKVHADRDGVTRFSGFRVAGGEVLTLINSAGRVITRLHVAHLRVAIRGDQRVIAAGTCQPGQYWGAPDMASQQLFAGFGSFVDLSGGGGSDNVCGNRGRARGMPAGAIEQVDDRSGGTTTTSVPHLDGHVPANDAVVSGPFHAFAQTGFAGPDGGRVPASARVSLSIRHAGGRVYRLRNVARRGGVLVRALPGGMYTATWVVWDRNGDTRTVQSAFEEQ